MLDQLLSGMETSAAFDRGSLLDQLKKALAERTLNAELDHHLAGEGGAGNSRNGYGRYSVVRNTGRMALEVPRDRQGSFDPLLIAMYPRRFPDKAAKLADGDVRAKRNGAGCDRPPIIATPRHITPAPRNPSRVSLATGVGMSSRPGLFA